MKIEAGLQCAYYNEQEYVNCIWGARLGRDERSIVKSGINLAKKRLQCYSNYSKQRFWLTSGSVGAHFSRKCIRFVPVDSGSAKHEAFPARSVVLNDY